MQVETKNISFETEDGEEVRFFVLEQTTLAGDNYLLVSETMEDEAEAYIMQELTDDETEKTYEIVDDEEKLEVLSKIFMELMDDVDIESQKGRREE